MQISISLAPLRSDSSTPLENLTLITGTINVTATPPSRPSVAKRASSAWSLLVGLATGFVTVGTAVSLGWGAVKVVRVLRSPRGVKVPDPSQQAAENASAPRKPADGEPAQPPK